MRVMLGSFCLGNFILLFGVTTKILPLGNIF